MPDNDSKTLIHYKPRGKKHTQTECGLTTDPDKPWGPDTPQWDTDWRQVTCQTCNPTRVTVAALKERGWTPAKIRDWLGPPDQTAKNPIYSTAAPMRLYNLERIEAAEAEQAEWFSKRVGRMVELRARAQKREAAAAAAEQQRHEARMEWANTVKIQVKPNNITEEKARREANLHAIQYADYRDNYATGDRALNNWLRHCRTNYDELLETVGRDYEAYSMVRNRVEWEIRKIYDYAPPADPVPPPPEEFYL